MGLCPVPSNNETLKEAKRIDSDLLDGNLKTEAACACACHVVWGWGHYIKEGTGLLGRNAAAKEREGGEGVRTGLSPALARALCDIPSGCCFFPGPWTVTRSSLRMLRRVTAFCRPLRPVLLLVAFPRSQSPVVGVLGLCWRQDVPFAR